MPDSFVSAKIKEVKPDWYHSIRRYEGSHCGLPHSHKIADTIYISRFSNTFDHPNIPETALTL
jgi:hypothetical protein